MISHATESGDIVRRDKDGQRGLVMAWTGESVNGVDRREVLLAIRRLPNEPFVRTYFPYSYFLENFTYVGKFE